MVCLIYAQQLEANMILIFGCLTSYNIPLQAGLGENQIMMTNNAQEQKSTAKKTLPNL